MNHIHESTLINDVYVTNLKSFADSRGRFMETFRKAWFPQRSWDIIQTNRSDSAKGVLRGLHYHTKQVDYWYVPRGRIRVGLVDLRPDSVTFLACQTIEMGEENEIGLFIPCGVAHGFLALTEATLTYIVDNYYDPNDELGVAWNDPSFNLNWGTDAPILSERDAQNPLLKELDLG